MSKKDSSDSEYDEFNLMLQRKNGQILPRKRRKTVHSENNDGAPAFSLQPLLDVQSNSLQPTTSFEEIAGKLLPECLEIRDTLLAKASDLDEKGHSLRPLTRSEVSTFVDKYQHLDYLSPADALILRKLKVEREKRRAFIQDRPYSLSSAPLTLLSPTGPTLPVNEQVLDALNSIGTTPFESSFLSRIQGTRAAEFADAIAIDWETVTPWMTLMADIREHYILANADSDLKMPTETIAPITYTTLQASSLPQIHDLLERVFWTGIDVSDSLDYSPEKSTVVAMYKKLVIGVAILSSPQETYITYLAVKAGWDKAQIARTMLYHLISMNPNKDIILHVSVNNSAMLLYNQFGFKAEEFVAGFYDNYLDPISRASKNAFKLRLRQ